VIAIHRGAADPVVRISSVSGDGTWTPTGATELQVPEGIPDVTFATFAPSRRLWLGLRYIDKDGDKVDYGAAEVDFEQGGVVYHRQGKGGGKKGRPLPNDIESAYFASDEDAWFGTRSGLVHWQGEKLTTFTENDGLESEIVHDVTLGVDGQVWIATSHGIGRYDGVKWSFPKPGEPLRVKATSLARDKLGAVFVGASGASGGLYACRRDEKLEEKVEHLDSKRGLLDNSVLDLAVDKGGRVWALTEKGISIVDR
jgi:ligand-binding sensor domain-containing protein